RAGLQRLSSGRSRGSRPGLREDRVFERRVSELPPLPSRRRRAGDADPGPRGRPGARMPPRLLPRVREGLLRKLKGTPMKASLPRRMTLHAIEAAALILGYRVKREPFDVVAFRGLYDGKRFHMRLETHGLERVPKGSEIDLHVDFMRDVTAFHGPRAVFVGVTSRSIRSTRIAFASSRRRVARARPTPFRRMAGSTKKSFTTRSRPSSADGE